MSIKIVINRIGEQLISKVEEMTYDEKPVGYFLIRPCRILCDGAVEDDNTGVTSLDIRLSPWLPLSKEERVPVPLDWIVSLVEPVSNLKSMYLQDVLKLTEDVQENNIILTDDCEECKP